MRSHHAFLPLVLGLCLALLAVHAAAENSPVPQKIAAKSETNPPPSSTLRSGDLISQGYEKDARTKAAEIKAKDADGGNARPPAKKAAKAPPTSNEVDKAPSKGNGADSSKPKKSAKAKAPKASIAVIRLEGSYPEKASQPGIFGELSSNLFDTVRRFDRAAKDEDIAAVVVDVRNPVMGRAQIGEVRAAIRRVRDERKPVYATLEMALTGDYLIASACDKIMLPESGTLLLPGVRAEVMFYKDLLDKIGVKADILQCGDFKGAAEPLTRSEMSDALRKQMTLMVDDLYDQTIDTIAVDRGLDRENVKGLIDQALISPKQARSGGLIDVIQYRDGLRRTIADDLSAEEVEFENGYGKKKVESEFEGLSGMLKLMEMMMGQEKDKAETGRKRLALIYAAGPIMTGQSESDLFGEETLGSDTLVAAIDKAAEDKDVIAVVLRVNSPGGSALASDLIWQAIERAKKEKPVIASMGDVAASGGYYISMGCDTIYVDPGTITGSIGVVGGKLALGGLYAKLGLKTTVISRGKNSGLFSSEEPFTSSERKAWQGMMQETYRMFKAKAATGRNIPAKKLEGLAGGRIWTGQRAIKNGLADKTGTLYEALKDAKQRGGIGDDEKVDLLILPKPRSFFEQLFDTEGAAAEAVVARRAATAAWQELAPAGFEGLRDVSACRRLFAEPSLLWMPYRIDVK